MNDGVITSGPGKGQHSLKNQQNSDIFNTENPMDDENSDEDIPEELKRDFVDEEDEFSSVYDCVSGIPNHTSTPRRQSRISKSSQRRFQSQASITGTSNADHPVMTNASLMLLRLCGKYLHLMQRLQPIAYDVFVAMTQLLEYYFINVHTFFTRDLVSKTIKVVKLFIQTCFFVRIIYLKSNGLFQIIERISPACIKFAILVSATTC